MQLKNGIALLVSHAWIGTMPKKSYNNVPISLNTHRPSMEKPKTRLLQVKTEIVQLFNSYFTNTVTLWSSKTLKGSYARFMKPKSKMTRSKKYIISKRKT